MSDLRSNIQEVLDAAKRIEEAAPKILDKEKPVKKAKREIGTALSTIKSMTPKIRAGLREVFDNSEGE